VILNQDLNHCKSAGRKSIVLWYITNNHIGWYYCSLGGIELVGKLQWLMILENVFRRN